jgi:hypothetical protein
VIKGPAEAMDELTKAIWFASAVFIAVFGNVALYLYLRCKGVRIIFAFGGTPVYLDYLYYALRREQNRSGLSVILLRILSFANVAAATYFSFKR